MKVRLVQMTVCSNVERNIGKAIDLAFSTPNRGIDVILFPELFTTGHRFSDTSQRSHDRDDALFGLFTSLAKQYAVNIVLGSVALTRAQGVFNTCFVINRLGELVGEYSKVHLFSLMEEDKFLVPGERTLVCKIDGVLITTLICYDLRFPELSRQLFIRHQPEVFFVPMAWPAPRTEAFRTLVRARAIENQCFVVTANRVGAANGVGFEGYSMVSDPDGRIVSELPFAEGVLDVELDLSLVRRARRSIKCLADRRERVYETI